MCKGFEISDNVSCIKKYFVHDKELVIANDTSDWFDKIEYYINNPDKRLPIIDAGFEKVKTHHTYKNRVTQFIEVYRNL